MLFAAEAAGDSILYSAVAGVSAFVGSVFASILLEFWKNRLTKNTFFAQETWKERKQLYATLIGACGQYASSLRSMIADVQSRDDDPNRIPIRASAAQAREEALSALNTCEPEVEIFLCNRAKNAIRSLKSAGKDAKDIPDKLKAQMDAAVFARGELLEGAKTDLRT